MTYDKAAADRAYYAANRDGVRAYQKAWRQKNAAKLRADKAAYHVAHADRIRAKVRAWNEAHPGVARERTAKWVAANPQRKREIDHRRRAREGQRCDHEACDAIGPLSLAAQLNPRRCYVCGATGRLQWDHLVPLALGGLHCASNLRPCCARCNQSKGARWITYDHAPPADWHGHRTLLRFVMGPGVPPADYFVFPADAFLDWFGKDE